MADHDTAKTCTDLALSEARSGDALRVAHNMPFVAQLIANARDVATPHRRRKSDRSGPLRAYAALDALPGGGTRRIV